MKYFIWRSIDRLRAGGIAAFVVSRYLMDKGGLVCREKLAGMADLIAAIRMPERAMFRAAGTDVVVDLLFFRRRDEAMEATPCEWMDVRGVPAVFGAKQVVVNEYWTAHPEMVLGQHGMASSQFGPA